MKMRKAILAAGLLALASALTGCSTQGYHDYMETHDPAPQQNANQHIQDQQQMNALRHARVKAL